MKKVLKDPWAVGIGTTLLGVLLTIIYDLTKQKQLFSTIYNICHAIWSALIAFFALSLTLKVWWLLAVLICLLLSLMLRNRYIAKKSDKTPTPPFLQYTKDTIQGWNWKWTYQPNGMGQYTIGDLYPVCGKCGTPLVEGKTFSDSCVCPRCNHKYKEQLPDIRDIHLLISDNIKRGLYQNSEEKQ